MSTPASAFAAATAVPIDAASERRAWFQALCDTYEADRETSWDGFVQNLAGAVEQAGVRQDVVTEFVRVMAELPAPLEVVAEMHQAGVDTLDAAYESAYEDVAQAGAGFEEGAADTDPKVWHATLHELGARWDRDEASWLTFREWFSYETGQRGLGAEGQAFVEYAEAGDKVQVFDEYGVPGYALATRETAADAPAVAEFPVVTEGDSGDWVAYADELLTRAGY
ncbi:hypothetical protein [Actinophytocola glycyrrhizae]|uniref:Uncharacterized protein n=1 Tax=Actinophytocola glycyrrhizae TaxID=2044873 RepID=A0ABV9S816_9PSEU